MVLAWRVALACVSADVSQVNVVHGERGDELFGGVDDGDGGVGVCEFELVGEGVRGGGVGVADDEGGGCGEVGCEEVAGHWEAHATEADEGEGCCSGHGGC